MEGDAAWPQITAVSRDNAGGALMEKGEWLQSVGGRWDFGVDLRLRDTVTEMPGRCLKTGHHGAAVVHEKPVLPRPLLASSRCDCHCHRCHCSWNLDSSASVVKYVCRFPEIVWFPIIAATYRFVDVLPSNILHLHESFFFDLCKSPLAVYLYSYMKCT